MGRRSITLSKTTEKKIDSFCKNYLIDDDNKQIFHNIIESDNKNIKECTEKSIVDFYIETAESKINDGEEICEQFWNDLIPIVRKKLVNKYASTKTYDNNIDIYFNEVRNVYIEHPQNECNDLEFIPENRDIFIKNNLKLVIECAKRYNGLGVPFEDLIQIGNEGLIEAFNRFDTSRANLRNAIIKSIENFENESFTHEDAEEIIRTNFTYSKNLDMTLSKLPENGFENKKAFIEWSKEHIKTAVFASVAFQWIRAYILTHISQYGKIINIPKNIQNKLGSTVIVRLDSLNPHTEDAYHDNQISDYINNEITIEQELFEDEEHNTRVKEIVEEILMHLNGTDRRIIKKKFGIGYPFPMSITDIAASENLQPNKVKYSISNSMKVLAEKVKDKDIMNEVFA